MEPICASHIADAGLGTQGAGKSTLTAAIFRLAELSAGTISIDDVNLATVPLRDVRGHAVCLIAQESLLFSGTLRYACQCRYWQLVSESYRSLTTKLLHRAPYNAQQEQRGSLRRI
jgi:ABC-type transport system involved in Fe-S cluster assembly fused permease/ATPase subunit